MNLWIRSQDRKRLCKPNNLFLKNKAICCNCNEEDNSFDYLGVYSTEERALEVLDEIQKLIDPVLVFKNCECDNDTLKAIKEIGACMVNDNSYIEQIQSCVYEMPEE